MPEVCDQPGHGYEFPSEARRDIYAYLAALFLSPPADTAIDIMSRQGEIDDLIGVLAGEDGERYLQHWRHRQADNEQVRQSFAELFRIPGASFTTPYESVMLAELGQSASLAESWRDGMNRLMHFYREQGGAVTERRVAADYIGVELDFMRFLCERETQASSEELDLIRCTQQEFLQQHLCRWLPLLQERIEEKDELGFYRLAALLARRMVEHHSRQLAGPGP